VSVCVGVAASSSSAVESLSSIRSSSVAAVELLDIVVHAHPPLDTNARARAIHLFTLNRFVECRAVYTYRYSTCNGNHIQWSDR
jgi:hypothetical protein